MIPHTDLFLTVPVQAASRADWSKFLQEGFSRAWTIRHLKTEADLWPGQRAQLAPEIEIKWMKAVCPLLIHGKNSRTTPYQLPAAMSTKGWCSASCGWSLFGSELACGPGKHPSVHPGLETRAGKERVQLAVRRPLGPSLTQDTDLSLFWDPSESQCLKTESSEQNTAICPQAEDDERPCELPPAPSPGRTGDLSHTDVMWSEQGRKPTTSQCNAVKPGMQGPRIGCGEPYTFFH